METELVFKDPKQKNTLFTPLQSIFITHTVKQSHGLFWHSFVFGQTKQSFPLSFIIIVSPTHISLCLSSFADLMSKKIKGVPMDSSIVFKHQKLVHDYHKLEKETEAAKNKLEAMKLKKLTVLAEVRFLHQRRKHLLEMKAANAQEQSPILKSCQKSSRKEKGHGKKEMKLQSKAPIWDLKMKEMSSCSKKPSFNQKERKIIGKGAFVTSESLGFDLNQDREYSTKEVTFKHPSEVLGLKQKERLFVGKETNLQKTNSGFDLNQMERSCTVKEAAVLNKAPVFDLNLKLGEDEDLQESYETSRPEELKHIYDAENESDLTLSICRNVENVPSHSGKRKLPWQDPVALKV